MDGAEGRQCKEKDWMCGWLDGAERSLGREGEVRWYVALGSLILRHLAALLVSAMSIEVQGFYLVMFSLVFWGFQ